MRLLNAFSAIKQTLNAHFAQFHNNNNSRQSPNGVRNFKSNLNSKCNPHTHADKKEKRKVFLTLKMAKTRTLLLAYFIFSSESQRGEREGEEAAHEAELCSTETENHVLTSNNNNNIDNNKNLNALISYNQKWHLKFCCCFWQSF